MAFKPMLRWLHLALLVWPISLSAATVYFNGQDFKNGYYLVPDSLPASGKKPWVVVHVHGAGGLRNEKFGPEITQILAPEPVIVLVPSFADGYQSGDGASAKQLIENFRQIAKSHPVQAKMFLHGHSGGAQFVHRFAIEHPQLVCGVSAHSAGTWATGDGFGQLSAGIATIPFLISCGAQDTAKSFANSPHSRIEWYRIFAQELQRKKIVFYGNEWPGAGHGVSMNLYATQLRECFLLATRGEIPKSPGWQGDVKRLATSILRTAPKP